MDRLIADAPPVSAALAAGVIDAALGLRAEQAFALVGPATGSGTVHRPGPPGEDP